MSAPEFLELGIDLLAAKAKDGTLGIEAIWLALRGARKYRDAMKTGDRASHELAALRAGMQCATCESRRERDTGLERDGGVVIAGSCGELLIENLKGSRPTCGCLVYVQVNGRVLPAGKTHVASEKCPQGKW